jgi:mutator protein MutT
MRTSSPRRVLHVVAIALIRAHPRRLFVARRHPDKRHGGLWELPGGQVEAGESEGEALRREIQEELSIDVTLGERLGEATVSAGAFDVRMAVHAADHWTGEIALVDHDACRWLTADALESVRWAPADIPHLAALRALLTEAEPPKR